MRGDEDLGGGNNAYFKLESGFQIDTGGQSSASSLFNRETYVGLGSQTFGSIQAGSLYGPSIKMSVRVDPFVRSTVGAQYSLLQGTQGGALRGYAVQYQDAIQYTSPTFAGLSAKVLVSAAEGAPTGTSHAAALDYIAGPLYLGFTYDQINTSRASLGLAPGTPVRQTNYSFGMSWQLALARLGGWYQLNHVDDLRDVTGWMLGATVPVSEFSDIRASFARRDQNNANASLLAGSYFYRLSRRTQLYTAAARLINSGTAAFGIWPLAPPNPDLGPPASGPLAPGRDIRAFQVGVLHVF